MANLNLTVESEGSTQLEFWGAFDFPSTILLSCCLITLHSGPYMYSTLNTSKTQKSFKQEWVPQSRRPVLSQSVLHFDTFDTFDHHRGFVFQSLHACRLDRSGRAIKEGDKVDGFLSARFWLVAVCCRSGSLSTVFKRTEVHALVIER